MPTEGYLREVAVSTTAELRAALENAQPGDDILLAPGDYTNAETGTKGATFHAKAEGTQANPIRIRSAFADDPAALCGTDLAAGIVLYVTGDYWRVEDITVGGAQKGILLDHANHGVLKNCRVDGTGSEGIHLRDDSADCLVTGCTVVNTGRVKAGYGEGVYVGSAKSTTGYGFACDRNVIEHCTLGPGVTAELVDIKEGTTGTVVRGCTLYGADIAGETSANSLLNAKGNDALIAGNTCYRDENAIIRNAFEVHCQLKGWGENNRFVDNLCHLDESDAYILRVYSGSASASGNVRTPQGNTILAYSGGTLIDEDVVQ